jgi:hypothetical protein
MSGEQHGEYMEISWDHEEPDWEAVRGHVTLAEFNEALEHFGVEPVEAEAQIRHSYIRAVPDSTGLYDMRYQFDVTRGCGAFAVTLYKCA